MVRALIVDSGVFVRTVLGVWGVAVGAVLVLAGPVAADFEPGAEFQLGVGAQFGRCAEVEAETALLRVVDCSKEPGQVFTWDAESEHVIGGGLCAEAPAVADASVKMAPCAEDEVAQRWRLSDIQRIVGGGRTGFCWDAGGVGLPHRVIYSLCSDGFDAAQQFPPARKQPKPPTFPKLADLPKFLGFPKLPDLSKAPKFGPF